MSRALAWIRDHQWVITEEAAETIYQIAARLDDLPSPDAIERELGRPLEFTREVRVRDGVAVIPVAGPLFRYGNLFTRFSGATSLEVLATDIGRALSDESVRSIVLDIDSPGGEVNGTKELSELVYEARSEKRIVAFVSDRGQSGGYWIASAAHEVVAAETARLGSIGAALTILGFQKADEKRGIQRLEFISSQSPKKRLDPFDEDEARARAANAEYQQLVDALGGVFVENVARNRGRDVDEVLEGFGQGGSFVGTDAVAAGLADRTGTLEGLIRELGTRNTGPGSSSRGSLKSTAAGGLVTSTGEAEMPENVNAPATEAPTINRAYLDANHADLVAEIREEGEEAGADAERTRIMGIHKLPGAEGFEDLKTEMMEDPSISRGDAAARILEARTEREQRRKQSVKDSLQADEDALAEDGPGASPPTEADENPVRAQAQTILNA